MRVKTKPNTNPKKGDLRVWNIKNPPNEGDRYPVKTIEHARDLIHALTESQLLDPEIHSNCFGLELFDGHEWFDWENDDGMQFDEWENLNPANEYK